MSEEVERIEKWECCACCPGLPPCKVEIPTENPMITIVDQCITSLKRRNDPDWQLIAYKKVKFNWEGGIEKELTDWITNKDMDNQTYPNKRRNNHG